ncbi:MAG: hypothetical protein GY753_10260 [Gammaproteobacteria bacterium]|nr:hypothetical protein [Gammaproteobacteria bacterium]
MTREHLSGTRLADKNKVRTTIPENCREAPACIDYKSYVFMVPQDLMRASYQLLHKRLLGLGRLRHEMLGVCYMDAEWGLLVVPPHGYQEMKVNFFHHITRERIGHILTEIADLLKQAGEFRG